MMMTFYFNQDPDTGYAVATNKMSRLVIDVERYERRGPWVPALNHRAYVPTTVRYHITSIRTWRDDDGTFRTLLGGYRINKRTNSTFGREQFISGSRYIITVD